MVPLPCLLIHQLLMFNIICFGHKLWCLYHGLATIDVSSVRPEKCLLWTVCRCYALPKQCGKESLCMLSQIDDMEQNMQVECSSSCSQFTEGNISVLLGFLNCFLWTTNLWFLYKETKWFSGGAQVLLQSSALPIAGLFYSIAHKQKK